MVKLNKLNNFINFIGNIKDKIKQERDLVEYYAVSKCEEMSNNPNSKTYKAYKNFIKPEINKMYQKEFKRNATEEELDYIAKEELKNAKQKFIEKKALENIKLNNSNVNDIVKSLDNAEKE